MTKRMLVLPLVTGVLVTAAAGALFFGKLSSAQETAAELIIYTGEGFTGRSLRVTDTQLDMPLWKDTDGQEHSWNDSITSLVVVQGTWRVFEHGRGNRRLDETALEDLDLTTKEPAAGWSCLVSGSESGPVMYDRENTFFAPRQISSIQLVSFENLPDWAFSPPK